jgi:hypothetical protein
VSFAYKRVTRARESHVRRCSALSLLHRRRRLAVRAERARDFYVGLLERTYGRYCHGAQLRVI